MEALGSQLQLLRGNPQALAALAMSDLQSLEAELEHTCRCVRATLLQRSTDEAALRASHEKATCALCLEEVKAMVFNCGHQSCSACAAKLQACPFC
ncbi:RING-type domain-containing protein, partial [Haematococcus lacustris]